MSISNALNISMSGLTTTQTGIELIARNIANSGVDGYSRKTASYQEVVAYGNISGVVKGSVSRELDEFIQKQLLHEVTQLANAQTKADILQHVNQLFGAPGGASSLDTLVNQFHTSLQELVSSPESYAARETVVAQAQALTNQLNSISDNIINLRQVAEDQLALGVNEVNDALQQLHNINAQIKNLPKGTTEYTDLLDQRDRFVNKIASYMDVSFSELETGEARLYTSDGHKLLDATLSQLSFDHQGTLNAHSAYSNIPAERSIGTITLHGSNGFEIDMLNSAHNLGGELGALVSLRDDILTQTQRQLDEIASSMALALSTETVDGTAASVGAASGYDLDVSGLASGNIISLNYTDNVGSQSYQVSIVRVDDPSLLPLSNDLTPNPNDMVIGIDFSGGLAAAAASLDAALGANITVSSPAAGVLRIVDDGAANNTDINALSAGVTVSGPQDQGLGINFFVDGQQKNLTYSSHLGPPDQKTGFASRIAVNLSIKDNNELLVRYTSTPEVPLGDNTRPLDILRRMDEISTNFSPQSGIGGDINPFQGTVMDFARMVVDFQTSAAGRADQVLAGQEIVTSSLKERAQAASGVDVDQELSNLLILQQAFAANARVMQSASDMLDELMNITL